MHSKVVALVAAAFGVVACGPAWAGWPDDKPIEVVIGFAPGGGTDVMARKLLPFVEQRLGGKVKFVVLNKPGAGGEIAFAAIARAAPDAYAIGVVNVPGYNFIPMTRKTQYGMDEIRLIARVVDDPSVIVVPAESKFTNSCRRAGGAAQQAGFGNVRSQWCGHEWTSRDPHAGERRQSRAQRNLL